MVRHFGFMSAGEAALLRHLKLIDVRATELDANTGQPTLLDRLA
jgi:hypothetical protein